MRGGAWKGMPVQDRLMSRVAMTEAGCWEWTGNRNPKGYGSLSRDGKVVRAHRVAYELANGPIPDGLFVLHSCDNPPCVNPAHLSVGTAQDNTSDMFAKGRARPARGAASGRLKHSDQDIRDIRVASAAGESLSKLAARYGSSPHYIWCIVKRRVRADV